MVLVGTGVSVELRLTFPASPEGASRHAAAVVQVARNVSGVDLDYSPESLRDVDGLIEGFRADGAALEVVKEALFCFGCYVGEVLVRHAGGRWRRTEDTSLREVVDWPLLVELPGEDNLCNPIRKAFQRFANGADDSIVEFYRIFTRPKS